MRRPEKAVLPCESIAASNNGVAFVTSHKECDIGVDRQAGVTASLHIESYSEFANKYTHAREYRPCRVPRSLHLAPLRCLYKIEIAFTTSQTLSFCLMLKESINKLNEPASALKH